MSLNNLWKWEASNHLWYIEPINSARSDTLSQVYKTTDMWLNAFKSAHGSIFNKIWWLNIQTHRELAQEIVNSKDVKNEEIENLLKWYVDSNIKLEIVLALYNRYKKVDTKLIMSIQGNLINITKLEDWVMRIDNSSAYKETLLIFQNWKIIKWWLESIENDKDLKWWFIYKVVWYKKHKSSWEIAK